MENGAREPTRQEKGNAPEIEVEGAREPTSNNDKLVGARAPKTTENLLEGTDLDLDQFLMTIESDSISQSMDFKSQSIGFEIMDQSMDIEIEELLASLEPVINNSQKMIVKKPSTSNLRKVKFVRTLNNHDSHIAKRLRMNKHNALAPADEQTASRPTIPTPSPSPSDQKGQVTTPTPSSSDQKGQVSTPTPSPSDQRGQVIKIGPLQGLRPARALWEGPCPWTTPHPPSAYYKQWVDPLAALKQRQNYVPLGVLVSVTDQRHVRGQILEKWRPDEGIDIGGFIDWLRENIREQVQGVFSLVHENRFDHWVRVINTVHWRITKEDLRLAVKIRYRGALHELETLRASGQVPTRKEVDLVTALLWWPANLRHEFRGQ